MVPTLISRLRTILYEPTVHKVNVDDQELLGIHRSILLGKPLLRSAFVTFYEEMSRLSDRYLSAGGLEVELGSGAGFFKSVRPGLISSDVRSGAHIDLAVDAMNMPMGDASVRCVYAINVFHHLSNPERFFDELCRVLQPGGGCILVEPHGGFSSALVHRHLHTDEHFDPDASNWQTATIGGPLSGANQALAHIVFRRDQARFQELYGKRLEIVSRSYALNSLRYLLSGGLNFRQLLPSAFGPLLQLMERLGAPLARHWSLHQIIVLRKK